MSDSFTTPWTVACQAPLSMRISQTRILEWVAIFFSRGSSLPKNRTCVSCIAGGFFITESPGRPYSPPSGCKLVEREGDELSFLLVYKGNMNF